MTPLKDVQDQIRSLLDREMIDRLRLKSQMVGPLAITRLQEEMNVIRQWMNAIELNK